MLNFYNAYKEKILPFILYRFQRSIGINFGAELDRFYLSNPFVSISFL